ncbi:MAG: class I SAM-dependent methyltransferase [Pseudomonadota bacterium]
MTSCILCRALDAEAFLTVADPDRERRYYRCATCALRFLDPAQHPDRATERAHYDFHENDPRDAGYRRFLSRLADPLVAKLAPGARGLDYGCGPGPALAHMLSDAGFRMSVFDPIYANDTAALAPTTAYDFVTCTETAEHFHNPAREFNRLERLIRPGGTLAIMTCFQTDDARFANWHYRKDPTHVAFYREETFAWLAQARAWELNVPHKDVAIFSVPPTAKLAVSP